jgi:2-polyprenyl-3-methyl-5-hydroxy-6-metoxy-1,4-benzoquinol methylase
MKKPSYYSAQESAYKIIRQKGEAGWMKKTFEDFRDGKTDKIIQNYVSSYFQMTTGLSALDLGTGSGPTAHTLHDLGFKVTGIDICPSAIELAREIARKEGKEINFEIADVLKINQKFDLIYDSHCVHCVVLDEDRKSFFKAIHSSLNENGVFILDSMAFKEGDESWKSMETLRFDENFILWHKTMGETHTGVVKENETYWCPQRRIYPVEKLMDELKEHGFKILSHSLDGQGDNEPFMLRAMCKRT